MRGTHCLRTAKDLAASQADLEKQVKAAAAAAAAAAVSASAAAGPIKDPSAVVASGGDGDWELRAVQSAAVELREELRAAQEDRERTVRWLCTLFDVELALSWRRVGVGLGGVGVGSWVALGGQLGGQLVGVVWHCVALGGVGWRWLRTLVGVGWHHTSLVCCIVSSQFSLHLSTQYGNSMETA